jgi:peptidoglycan/xylan/chitin deacetylase (PgdA/CDA1 family)
MRARLLLTIALLLPCAASSNVAARPQFTAVVFHDVVDRAGEGDSNAVTAADLIAFFEWLRGNGWTAITVDDIERARSGTRPLPDRAILITFDDGNRSLYTRVYPLLLAYRIPIVAALVGAWIGNPQRETVRLGEDLIPGSGVLLSWDEAREMARSGLVEFASHTYDMHQTQLGNPLGGEMPAAAVRVYDPSAGYETEASYRRRIRSDLERSSAVMLKELGVAPRALAWPYGRYTEVAQQEALAANYKYLFTLEPEPGFLDDLPNIPRLTPVGRLDLRSMISQPVAPPTAVRIVRLNPEMLSPMDSARFEKALGATIERVKTLGATTVVVEAATRGPQGRLESVWFPNRAIPVKSDVLSRIVWQLRTRAGVDVVVSLSQSGARATVGDDAAVVRLFEDLGYSALADALWLDTAPALAAIPSDPSTGGSRWEVRRRRNLLDPSRLPEPDGLSLRSFHAFEHVRPAARLFLLTPHAGDPPSAVADITLVETPPDARPFRAVVDRMAAAGSLGLDRRYRVGVWIVGENPPSAAVLAANLRLFQRRGGVAFGWKQDDPIADEPRAALAAPAVSAATIPLLRKR